MNPRLLKSVIIFVAGALFGGVVVYLANSRKEGKIAQSPPPTLSTTKTDSNRKENNKKVAKPSREEEISDSLTTAAHSSDILANADSLFAKNDSVIKALDVDTVSTPDEVVVERENMVRALSVDLEISENADPDPSDSLLGTTARIQAAPAQQVAVEWWTSPVNYRGYKFNGRKLILYSYNEENIRLIKHRDDTYLYNGRGLYLLVDNERRQPFMKTDNPVVYDYLSNAD